MLVDHLGVENKHWTSTNILWCVLRGDTNSVRVAIMLIDVICLNIFQIARFVSQSILQYLKLDYIPGKSNWISIWRVCIFSFNCVISSETSIVAPVQRIT